ncbi:Indoleamine 2,3-dioxygenase [Atractiella rhizophila]|nr:Indoleamine 2,3-dioxygenase [Atractiella rhizophila]
MAADSLMPSEASLELGFLPTKEPVSDLRPLLPNTFWAKLEDLIRRAPEECSLASGDFENSEATASMKWRNEVEELGNYDCSELKDKDVKRRALVLLTLTVQFYVHSEHSGEETKFVVPKSISRILLELSDEMGMQPVLSYSTLVLWNWSFQDPSKGYTIDNFAPTSTFLPRSNPGVTSELDFNKTSLIAELLGASALSIIVSSSPSTPSSLQRLSQIIIKMTDAMYQNSQTISSGVFYHQYRPWIMGGTYAFQVGDSTVVKELGGPTAGQSTLLHSIDVFLGVEHSSGFMDSMSHYMPASNRRFLTEIKSIRETVLLSDDAELKAAYNEAVAALKRFRDFHFRMVARLVIVEARTGKLAQPNGDEEGLALKGSGGSDLSKFLKQARDATTATMVE